MRTMTLAAAIATLLDAKANCAKAGNVVWESEHTAALDRLCRDKLPSGAGIDAGAQLDESASSALKLVFDSDFHHMNEHGTYDGWTKHRVTVTPDFTGVRVAVSGRDRNQIKDYLGATFEHAMTESLDLDSYYRT